MNNVIAEKDLSVEDLMLKFKDISRNTNNSLLEAGQQGCKKIQGILVLLKADGLNCREQIAEL